MPLLVKKPKVIYRRKNIIIEDCMKSMLSHDLYKQSKILNCRTPFKADDGLINYDLDTEDELAEEYGEDLQEGDNNMSVDDEEDLEEK